MSILDPIKLAQEFIRKQSITPIDDNIVDLTSDILKQLGADVEVVEFQSKGLYLVRNIYARLKRGNPKKTLALCAHLDVVPVGEADSWSFPPFEAVINDSKLYGRGATDMKGNIASFFAALSHCNDLNNIDIVFFITLDEESLAQDGIKKLVPWAIEKYDLKLDGCLVCEPSSNKVLGDYIKIGRRGSLNFNITSHGCSGHVAYYEDLINPLDKIYTILNKLYNIKKLDSGNKIFAASNIEIVNIGSDSTAYNLVPSKAWIKGNIRFNDLHTVDKLAVVLKDIVGDDGALEILPDASNPSYTSEDTLIFQSMKYAISSVMNISTSAYTGGGTSDARFINHLCDVIEFGLLTNTMHQVDEHANTEEIINLTKIYTAFIKYYYQD